MGRKLKLINRKKELCQVCKTWNVIDILDCGGSSIIISYYNRGIGHICQNCGAEYD
jgi:hypothetical protein